MGGSLSGLAQGQSIVLQNNGGDDLMLAADGSFTFPAPLADETAYSVSILTPPTGQTCTLTGANGTLAGFDVTNVGVNCTNDEFTLGGFLSGLVTGDTVVIQNNGGDDLALTADGPFTFSTPLNFGDTFAVTVASQPTAPSETCTVIHGNRVMPASNVTDVSVTCSVDSFTVGGTVSGLASGAVLVIQNNGAFDQTVTNNGNFVFPPLADGTAYSVEVLAQPDSPKQACTITNGTGVLSGSDVSNVSVDCLDASNNANFDVSKIYTDGNDAPVDVILTCNAGLPLMQTFSISPGNPVSAVVTNLGQEPARCEVTEGGDPGSYRPSFDNGTTVSTRSCVFDNVLGGLAYSCEITNSPATFDFVVDFKWDVTAAEATGSVSFTVSCVNVVDATGVVITTPLVGPTFTAFATVNDAFEWRGVGAVNDEENSDGDPINPTRCWADVVSVTDTTVEVTGCDPFEVSPGEDEANCTMTASVFFEGIPVLSQRGLTLMALLMLGMGVVGLRRFA